MNFIVNNPPHTRFLSSALLNQVDQEFRQWLQQLGFWSETAERLFLHLKTSQHIPIPVTSQQKQLLEQVVEEALNGVDITKRYPAFFRDLLHNAALRQELINTISLLQA